MSLLNGVLTYSRALCALGAWRSRVFYVLACLACFTCLLAWHARVLYELGMVTCLACYIKWSAWRASKNGVLDEVKIDELFS